MKQIGIIISVLLFGITAQAAVYTPTSLPNPKEINRYDYVCNPDGVVDSNEVIALNRLARQLEDSTEVELCVVAVESIGEMEAFDFCYELFQRWGIGKEGKNTGVLLFLAVESRDIRIMTGGGIEGILTDAVCHDIIQKVAIPPLRNGDYSDGLALSALRIYEVCSDGSAPEELRNMISATNRYHYADESEENAWLEIFYYVGVPLLVFALIMVLSWMPKKCPKCGKRSYHKTNERVIVRATLRNEGLGMRTFTCKHCGYSEEKSYIIPKEVPIVIGGGSSRGGFGGGSFGGGFGGGSTFGGGAGGRF